MDNQASKPESDAKPNLAAQLYEQMEKEPQKEWRRSDARKKLWESLEMEVGLKVLKVSRRDVAPDSLAVSCRARIEIYTDVRVRLGSTGEWHAAQVVGCKPAAVGFVVVLKFE